MADIDSRITENEPGRFYVDTACINCAACKFQAPEHFEVIPGVEMYRIRRQPANADELDRVLEAMEVCPVGSIGDDGAVGEALAVQAVSLQKSERVYEHFKR